MPYSNPRQPQAIFLNIKRRQGLEAAKRFGRKHRDSFKAKASMYPSDQGGPPPRPGSLQEQQNKRDRRRARRYRTRSSRSY